MKRILLILIGAALAGCLSSADCPAQSVWEMTPYRIQLIVAVAPSLPGGARLETDLAQGLVERMDAEVGVLWDARPLAPSARLRHRMTTDLDALRVEDLPEESLALDKVFCVAVTPGPTGHNLAARELDVRSRVFGPVRREAVLQPFKLRDAAMRALLRVFTPLAIIVQSEGKTATLRLQGGQLPVRKIAVQTLQPGDVLQPLIRYNDRDGNLRKVMPIPWTFLVVEQFDPQIFRCQTHSALINPLSGRRRGRVEQLALVVRPLGRSTRLVLTSRDEPDVPLAGYQIYTQPRDSKKTTLLGQTDAAGAVTIATGDHPLRLVVVKSGKKLLARLPIVPGLEPELSAAIARDDQRLEAEGFTAGVQEDLVDLVTRRDILITKGEKRIDEGEFEKAAAILAELHDLPTRDEMLRQLGQSQKRFQSDQPRTAKKIDELFEQTRQLISRFLDSAPIQKLDHDLLDARQRKQTPRPAPPAPARPANPAPKPKGLTL